jgi:hypothetical protein
MLKFKQLFLNNKNIDRGVGASLDGADNYAYAATSTDYFLIDVLCCHDIYCDRYLGRTD